MATTIGANLSAKRSGRLLPKALKALGRKAHSFSKKFRVGNAGTQILVKAGVPASNTAADNPGRAGAIIYDSTNNDWYECNAWTSSSSFIIVQIAG